MSVHARLRHRLLAVAAALAAVALLLTALSARAGATGGGLKSLAEAKGIYFGTALTQGNLGVPALTAVAAAQFDMVTPGNEMKWDTTEPSDGSYDFAPGDQIVSYAQANGMRVRGHNLVWDSQLPSWVSSLPSAQVQSAMEGHITTEVTHYRGQVYSWDVVNEPFNDDGTLKQDVFFNAMGSGYIADALRTAHAADPGAKLYLNDYNIEGENAKSDAMYTLVRSLKAQGVPIDGVGFESHFILGQVPSTMAANLERFTALGVDVAVTELDDRIPLPATSADLAQQADDYAAVVQDCLAVSGCVGVSQWGVGDADSWIPGTFPGYGAATMFDSDYQPKPAYGAVVAALGGSATGPSASASASAPPSASGSPGAPAGGCQVADSVDAWNTGMTENITLTNTGATTLGAWSLVFTLGGGQAVSSTWNAAISPSTGQVTATNLSYNGTLAPGASASFGFQATQTGDFAAPASFSLGGVSCVG
ncbi:endo-1,4-beta-xylanase [Streptacidiphilus sp. P02-A3a]|uniref:endo-1,4-beta-xylanase n=1 Tax=Streptacidiphilus sp. P02-A3a TaxID=2704468 RepID=UPI0015F7B3EA|nr:endo-1,4-beta-xylanase [Streptacidiphilus sp. P02-A3a]QMU70152.1 glycoside hydrolase [Streptacidiphilus sp. P02-A3a]QMU70398.1 glycoside hydrolase [Streptacidiphilus sp. P02-A3a]